MEENLKFSVKLSEQHRQMTEWQSLHLRQDKLQSFLRFDLAKNTELRQLTMWEIFMVHIQLQKSL